MDSTRAIGKKDFRKEITKLKRDLKTFIVLSKKNAPEKHDERLDKMKDEIFSSIDNLPILFTSRRKKIYGAEDKNLMGFGKPTFVDKSLIDFFDLNFGVVSGKNFSTWFPVLFEFGIGSRIQLQSLLNLVIRVTEARIKEQKKREQILVKQMKNLDTLILNANHILSLRGKELIENRETITSSDILKLLNAFVSRESDLTDERRKLLDDQREKVRDENLTAKTLLDEYKI